MTSKTPRPRRKVLGAAFTGALVTLTVFVLNTYVISGQDRKITRLLGKRKAQSL